MKKINWADHLVAFVVVIVGIYIAFKLNSYSEGVARQRILDDHMKYVRDETVYNKRSLEMSIESAESVAETVEEMLELIKNEGDAGKMDQLSYQILNYQYVYLRKNAYLTLTESGDIRYIKNYKLKTETIRLYEYYAWTKSIEEYTGELLSESYAPYLRQHMDMLNRQVQADEIYFDKVFVNTIVSYKYSLSFMIKKYKDCLLEMENYLKLLEENGVKGTED
ncbi:MAG: hypothetical protein AAFO69_00340 [Bacteroidota bacterium]